MLATMYLLYTIALINYVTCGSIMVNADLEPQYGTLDIKDYNFIFNQAEESLTSLYIQVKHKKNKKTFRNTFNKSTLIEMNLRQSVERIINLLESAKNSSKGFMFKMGFGETQNTTTLSCDKLLASYVKGYALYIMVSVETAWYLDEYYFQLLEQKRGEVDILRDIVEDLQEDIKSMEDDLTILNTKQKDVHVAVWKSTSPATPVKWNIVHTPVTLNGMATVDNTQTNIVIGIAGYYKVFARFGFKSDWNSVLNHELRLNGAKIASARTHHSHSNTFVEILKLKANDKLQYWISNTVNNGYWDQYSNNFALEYLGE